MSDDNHSTAMHPFKMAAEAEKRKEACLEFFQTLLEKKFNFATFQKHWNEIEKLDLTAAELTTILTNCVTALDRLDSEKHPQIEDKQKELGKNCRSEIMFRFECWEKPATFVIGAFRQQDLAVCLNNYRILNLNPGDEFLTAWYKSADPSKALEGSDDETKIVKSLVSFAVAGLKPPQAYKEKWIPKATENAPYFRPGQLAFSFWSFAKFAEEPDQTFFKEWKERFNNLIENYPDHFRQRDLANIIGSCGALHAITDKSVYKTIARKAKEHIDLDKCNLPQKRQLWLAYLWFNWKYNAKPPPMDDRPSGLEISIKELFDKHGFPTNDRDRTVKTLGHKPDDNHFVNQREIFVEIDGRPHFLYEINEFDGSIQPAGYTGRTLFMSALIRKFAADTVLLRLPNKVCDMLLESDHSSQAKLVHDLMEDAAEIQPGAYHVRQTRLETPENHELIIRPLKIA